ncbi:uncharacterized protein KY384_006424 [Bacidia gigantensis]|uniref:uncharacterized protein n=1 Tax=Bacidia gigantensis TaxID=2732470 RepID=UPI001D04B3B7|nr:uncharacterized protein KY384_006424 [Bacidia gigantensis]KAG8528737.1 hypothetical protein KY384_006424 [Bacidia gigantensis]
MTELTRNPRKSRSPIEKNWMLFFLPSGEAFIHYDLPATSDSTRGRTLAKMLGNGLTTPNLTDPLESPCLHNAFEEEIAKQHASYNSTNKPKREVEHDKRKLMKWHQATNALRLVLCNRSDQKCKDTPENSIFFALVHRKVSNALKLPMRYERFFIAWSSTPPFHMIGISQHPILMRNESALGWTPSESWDDDPENAKIVAATKARIPKNASEPYGGKGHWASFTYTVSISYAWGRKPRKASHGDRSEDMHMGYLDDEVILAIGVDDEGGVFAQVEAKELVQCMRACSGRN